MSRRTCNVPLVSPEEVGEGLGMGEGGDINCQMVRLCGVCVGVRVNKMEHQL